MKRYVIIGGGVAGIQCVEGIRSADTEGSITLITAEENSNYGRPLISYYLEGATDEDKMSYRGQDFYETNHVTALHGACAEKLDPVAKTLTLSDGKVLPYDALCVAAGSSPFVPPFAGLDTVPAEVRKYRPEVDPAEVIGDMTLDKLHTIFDMILRRQTDRIDPVRSKFGTIEREEVSLPDKLENVAVFAKSHRKFSFRDLLERQSSRTQVVVTFLAVLELISYGFIRATQKEIADDIEIEQVPDISLDQVRKRFGKSDIVSEGA